MNRRSLIQSGLAGSLLGMTELWPNAADAATTYLVPNPYARGPSDFNAPSVNRLIVFGDSYSTGVDGSRPYVWGLQMLNEGSTRQFVDRATLGATAAHRPVNRQIISFANQLDLWAPQSTTLDPRDLFVVYFGQNDIFNFTGIAPSIVDLAAGIDRLITLGATAKGRRVFLVLLHDVCRNPTQAAGVETRYRDWAPQIARIAAARTNVILIDLTTTLNFVYAHPGFVGLTNVTTSDPDHTGSTALYLNGGHFGRRGHQLISQIMRYYLTYGWDAAHLLRPGSTAMRSSINRDIASRLVFRTLL